jgi:hypothetical protein
MALSRRRSSSAAESQSSRTGIITIRLKGGSSVKVDILIRSALLEQVADALAQARVNGVSQDECLLIGSLH